MKGRRCREGHVSASKATMLVMHMRGRDTVAAPGMRRRRGREHAEGCRSKL